MLQLLVGRSGSGKTHTIYQELKAAATNDVPLFLLVPEQASFENERRLLEELGPVHSQRVQVLSFTRMAEIVFREVGGTAGRRMDTTLSLLLMNEALHTVADRLTVYQKHVDDADYLRSLLITLSECKQCVVSPVLLAETAVSLPDGLLKNKLNDLALLFETYEALTAQASLIDPQDDLSLLAERLSESRLFDRARIYVDGFKGFTQQELSVLGKLMPHVETMTVALCTESITERRDQEKDRFATATRTANQLRDLARRAHVSVAAVRYLTQNHRTDDPALLTLEAGCFADDGIPYNEATDAVRITPCADRYEECRYAARFIRRRLREEGGYCRQYTIVARNINHYADLLENALSREGLPCCRDRREPILTQPLITLIESALSAINSGWGSDDVLRIVKSGLAGFSATSASLLENYVFTWNVRGQTWLSPFTLNPDGLTAKTTEDTENRLAYLEILRRRLIRPLQRLRSRLFGRVTGREFAEAVFRYLQEMRLPRTLKLQIARLDADKEHELADRQERLWDYVMSLLDKFALALPETRLTAKRCAELFHLIAASDDLGNIPQSLDGVIIGSADRIRYAAPHTVIVLGANEGVFPAYPSEHGLLTDSDRKQLQKIGLTMADDADWETAAERFYAYAAVAAPSKQLVVTYVRESGGESAEPSPLVAVIHKLLPCAKMDTATHPNTVDSESKADAFAALALQFRDNTPLSASYRTVFSSLPDYAAKLSAMQHLDDEFSFRDPSMARTLFGEHLSLSPTRVDTFHKCRFSYFCQHGLQLKTRRTAEMNPAESGTLVHHVMRELLPGYCQEGLDRLSRERVSSDTRRSVQRYLHDFVNGHELQDAQFQSLIDRLILLCEHLLWYVVCELRESRFRPIGFEFPIGRPDEGGIPAWVITTPDGSTIRVCGIIDRVDAYQENGITYIRVLDYKTGTKKFELADVLEGINLQMLIYLFSLSENGKAVYGNVVPAGVLYQRAVFPDLREDNREISSEALESKRVAAMRPSGLLLADVSVLCAMEPDMKGTFIPAEFKNGVLSSKASVASLAQFGRIQRHIQKLLISMVEQLHNGQIAAIPKIKHNASPQESPCSYCDFRDICGREDEDRSHAFANLSLSEALAFLDSADKEVSGNE